MRTVTSDFTDAILNGEDQIALVDFGDWSTNISSSWWFDETDIAADGGIKFGDNWCTDENLKLGTACNSIEITVFNRENIPTLEEFRVWVGVSTSSYTASTTRVAYADVDGDVIEVNSTSPYLYLNGSAVTSQPTASCKALEIVRTSTNNQYIALCIYADNTAKPYTLNTSTHTMVAYGGSYSTLQYFSDKWDGWYGLAVVRGKSNSLGYYYKFKTVDGNVTGHQYELCSLGYFYPSTTHTTNEEIISISGYDRMTLFDQDATDFLTNRDTTHMLSTVFSDLCAYVGVTGSIIGAINSVFVPTIGVDTSLSLRQVLGYLAEAMGCIAKFKPDGTLGLYWTTTNNTDIDYNFQRTVYNYSVAVIDKVQFGSVSYGSGSNIYYQDNNFCGLTANEVQNIYTRLNGFAAYTPCNASIFGHPGIESGDIVTVKNDSNDAGVSVPIFVNNFAWNGVGSATIESTGSETRPIDSDLERQLANTVTGDDLATSGKVEISGDNITAGIIRSHDGTSYFDLDNDEFVIENTTTYLQSNYSASDTTRIQDIILGNTPLTQADLDKYDWLGKGYLDVSDGLRVQKLIGGNYGASVSVTNKVKLSASDKEMLISASNKVGSATESYVFKAGGFGISSEDALITNLKAENVEIPVVSGGGFPLVLKNASDYSIVQIGAYTSNGGDVKISNHLGDDTFVLNGDLNGGGRERVYLDNGNVGASFGANSTRGGFFGLWNPSGTMVISAYGNTGEVSCVPQNVKSSFSITASTGTSSCSIVDAYKSAGFCTIRTSLVNADTVASGGEYKATITFPSGCTPQMVTSGGSYFGARYINGTLSTAGTVTYRNCGDSMTANHTVNIQFTYPCG